MAFITKKHLPRRTFLRGVGATIALPLLDSMVAAQTPIRKTAAAAKSRLSCIYVPHGATMDKWTPAATGKGFEFTEILSPLEKFRDRITIVSNLAHAKASAVGSDAGADHARSAAVFLSGAQPARDSIQVGETIDQIAARQIGQDTPLPSLELSIEDVALSCGSGYACAYSQHASPGRTPRRRCRWRTTRRSCSRSCSVMAATTPTARRVAGRAAACSTQCWDRSRRCETTCRQRSRSSDASISTTFARSSGGFRRPTRSSRATSRCRMRRSACPSRSMSTSRSCSTWRCWPSAPRSRASRR